MQSITTAFNYERDLLAACKQRQLSRVVTILADGVVRVSDSVDGIVQYLIFEQANGDARTLMDGGTQFDLTLKLSSLHHVATGLRQLHNLEIAHQDVKPSNVLVFPERSKIGDLGCASRKGNANPRDIFPVVGDKTYAPPELLYNFLPGDWEARRFACDVYLLGNMIVYFFAGLGITPLWRNHLAEIHRPGAWNGTFHEVLPFVRDAFGKAVTDFQDTFDCRAIRDELIPIVREGTMRARSWPTGTSTGAKPECPGTNFLSNAMSRALTCWYIAHAQVFIGTSGSFYSGQKTARDSTMANRGHVNPGFCELDSLLFRQHQASQ